MSLVPYKRNIAEEKKILEELLKEPAGGDLPEGSIDFKVEKIDGGYRISGVQHRKTSGAYDLSAKLLPSKTQEQHAKHAAKAKPEQYRAGSAPLYHAIFKTLYKNKDGKYKDVIQEIRVFLKETFENTWVNTLSKTTYNPAGQKDRVLHDAGQKDEYPVDEDITGPEGYITQAQTQASNACKAVLEDNNLQEINKVYKWVTDKDTYLWRLTQKPESSEERVVALGVDDYGYFDINTIDGISGNGPALGVRRAKNFP